MADNKEPQKEPWYKNAGITTIILAIIAIVFCIIILALDLSKHVHP